jgi:hypothetical protein
MAYNAQVWSECRAFAVAFLQEAKDRLGNRTQASFDEAIVHYQEVDAKLKRVAELFPFHGLEPEHIQDQQLRQEALERLRAARDAEASGLDGLQKIVDAL